MSRWKKKNERKIKKRKVGKKMSGIVQRCLVSYVEHLAGISKANQPYDYVKICYVRLDALASSVSPDGKRRGIKFKDESLDSGLYLQVPEAPAIYDIAFDYVQVRGEEKLLPVSFTYVSSFFDYFNGKKEKA